MNNKAKLRWGILGAARINQQLMPAIVEAENSELVAIASRRTGAAAGAANLPREFSIPIANATRQMRKI